MNIYSTKIYPYVYVCTHKITGHYYIGYRSANSVLSDIDLPKYKTSSLIVKPDFENYNWQILAEFFDGDDAYDFEQQLISEHWNDPLLLNEQHRHQCNGRFKTKPGRIVSDETKEKIRSKRAPLITCSSRATSIKFSSMLMRPDSSIQGGGGAISIPHQSKQALFLR